MSVSHVNSWLLDFTEMENVHRLIQEEQALLEQEGFLWNLNFKSLSIRLWF